LQLPKALIQKKKGGISTAQSNMAPLLAGSCSTEMFFIFTNKRFFIPPKGYLRGNKVHLLAYLVKLI
jgi:hypothetical protein